MIRAGVLSLVFAAHFAAAAGAQGVPLGSQSKRGQTVSPVYEGWYPNGDGTISFSFGYFNRNFEEVVEIPLGPDNYIEPAEFNGMQPTTFSTRRHWGVFAVRVPADFDPRGTVTWTLRFRGKTYSIPGHLHNDWRIDALEGEAGTENKPPILKFEMDQHGMAGPAGIMAPPQTGTVGQPVAISVWASDDGRPSSSVVRSGRTNTPVTLTWFKHQGPGNVTFAEESARIPPAGGVMETTATFDAPGEYVLRVRANDASGVAGAGHSQCCWTNGFVKVTIR